VILQVNGSLVKFYYHYVSFVHIRAVKSVIPNSFLFTLGHVMLGPLCGLFQFTHSLIYSGYFYKRLF